MPKSLIRTAYSCDAEYVALNLQSADLEEVKGLGFDDPVEALTLSVLNSDPAITFYTPDNWICGVAGVSRTDAHCGAIWMMTTPDVQRIPKLFVSEAKKWVDQLTSFDVLHNIADPRNKLHLKLLHILGFKRLGYRTVGPNRLTYVEFAKLTKCVSQ